MSQATSIDAVSLHGPEYNLGSTCEVIMRALPDWFGIEQAILDYASDIDALETFTARTGNEVIAFMSLKQHSDTSAELYVLGVLPHYHNQGVGRSLLEGIENYCRRQGIEFLQVKTLGPSRKNAAYEKTRSCYLAWGFVPVEEFPQLWGKDTPCLIMIKKI